MTVNDKDLLEEIRFDVEAKDIIKGKLVLSSLEHVSRQAQKEALSVVAEADDDYAIPLLTVVIGENPGIGESFPQIKETLLSKILYRPEILSDLILKKENSPERTFLIEIAGELRLKAAGPALSEALSGEDDRTTIEALIESLGLIGDEAAVDGISEFLYAGSRDVVFAAAEALGLIGTAAAVGYLSKRLGGDTDLDLKIVDILARAEGPEALEKLNETLDSEHAHIRTAGKKKLRAVGSTAVRVLVKNLTRDNVDLVIHSLNVLGDIGDAGAIRPIRTLLHNEPEDANVRFAAYEALGKLPLGKGAFVLAAGLEDMDDSVRSSAAKAIDANLNAALAAGLMNLIRHGEDEGRGIVRMVIDAECDKIFTTLFEEAIFKEPAMAYLEKKAHPDTRAHFAKILEKLGEGVSRDAQGEGGSSGRPKVFAVDDSKMILNIYRKVLHNLGCDPHLFEFPAGALERVRQEKPDIILTDLNMPDITGIDLTRGVRELYSFEELPIIMVTTQDEEKDNEAAYAAGISAILQKPFDEDQIGAVLKEFNALD